MINDFSGCTLSSKSSLASKHSRFRFRQSVCPEKCTEKFIVSHRIHVWHYGICTYIYHKSKPNVGKYTIHGSYGYMNCVQKPTFTSTKFSEHAKSHLARAFFLRQVRHVILWVWPPPSNSHKMKGFPTKKRNNSDRDWHPGWGVDQSYTLVGGFLANHSQKYAHVPKEENHLPEVSGQKMEKIIGKPTTLYFLDLLKIKMLGKSSNKYSPKRWAYHRDSPHGTIRKKNMQKKSKV